jgi:lipopolysaccharide export system protein LptA
MNRPATRALLAALALALTAPTAGAVAQAPAARDAAKDAGKSAPLGTVGGGKGPINVVAVQNDSTIRCSSLTVHYKRDRDKDPGKDSGKPADAAEAEKPKDANALAGNGIRKVECAGPVTVSQKDQVATGDNAVFDQEAKRIVLTGNVVLSQCQNVTRGSRLVYDMATGRANMDPVAGGRVSAMFVPGQGGDTQGKAGGGGSKGCTQPAIAAKPGAKAAEKAAADRPAAKTRAQAN